MKNILASFLVLVFVLMSKNVNADSLKKGAFICQSKELLSEMMSATVKIADANKNGNKAGEKQGQKMFMSLVLNNQCSVTDKNYPASMIKRGFSSHKIRVYDDEGNNFVVWTLREDYLTN
jgi:hypothetical protein